MNTFDINLVWYSHGGNFYRCMLEHDGKEILPVNFRRPFSFFSVRILSLSLDTDPLTWLLVHIQEKRGIRP